MGWIFLDDSGIYTAFPVPYPLIWDKNGRAKGRKRRQNAFSLRRDRGFLHHFILRVSPFRFFRVTSGKVPPRAKKFFFLPILKGYESHFPHHVDLSDRPRHFCLPVRLDGIRPVMGDLFLQSDRLPNCARVFGRGGALADFLGDILPPL